jgi:hypothetical protein
MNKNPKIRIHIRLDERTRDRLQMHSDFMSRSIGRRVTVGEWLATLLDNMQAKTMVEIRDRLKTEVTSR